MESQYGSSFYRIILDHHLKHGALNLPREFVHEHGEKLSKYAYLETPNGEKWKVKLKRSEGRIRLRKGLRHFFNYYRVKFGYFLLFEYKGDSFFHVLIFHPNAVEIDYHGDDISIATQEEEADVCIEISDETSQNPHKKRKVSSSNLSGRRRCNVTSASEETVQRAKAFRSANPHFIAQMSATYLSGNYMHIPQSHAQTYFKEAENGGLYLEGENGRAWFVKYSVGIGSRNHVRLYSGWKYFARENHLRMGDVCVFELINRATKTYKVTMFRNDDHEEINKNGPFDVVDGNSSFTVSMTPSLLSCMRVPTEHLRSHLKYNELGENIITFITSSGEKWKVPYYITPSEPDRAKLSNKWWQKFVLENHIQAGDRCAFEMINSTLKEYKVIIHHDSIGKTTNFESENPQFTIQMTQSYVSSKGLLLPKSHVRRHLGDMKEGKNVVTLHGSDGRTWPVLYCYQESCDRGRFGRGWTDFVSDNQLRVGDSCVFEMICGKTNAYNVTIHRLAR